MLFSKEHFCTNVFGRNQKLDLDLKKENSVRLKRNRRSCAKQRKFATVISSELNWLVKNLYITLILKKPWYFFLLKLKST